MRKTINKMSSQRIQKHMDAELRHIIEEKIEDLKKIKGANYNKIESKVQELILSLKQPDFYFADDEDVTQISDVQEKMDIKPRTDINFKFIKKQKQNTNLSYINIKGIIFSFFIFFLILNIIKIVYLL